MKVQGRQAFSRLFPDARERPAMQGLLFSEVDPEAV